MPDLLSQALDFVMAHEGGYSNDPGDTGGETNFGISKRAYPHLDIAALTEAEAREVLARDYWARLRLDRLPAPLALVMVDTAVNLGRGRAVRLLQAAYNKLAVGDELQVDGVLGPKTEYAVVSWCGGNWSASPCRSYCLAADVLFRRLEFYLDLAAGNQQMRRYLAGWTRRVAGLQELLRNTAEFTAI